MRDLIDFYKLDPQKLSPVHSISREHPDVLTMQQVDELVKGEHSAPASAALRKSKKAILPRLSGLEQALLRKQESMHAPGWASYCR